jgi:hypothetical protein
MAPLPTIGNCVRVSINWSQVAGVRPVNVLHLITASDDEEEIATELGDAFIAGGSNVFQCVQESYTIDSYTVTLLDGSSAGQVIGESRTIGGQGSGEILPAQAGVLSLRTSQRGPRGRGRLYLGPCSEGTIANGLMTGSISVTMPLAWQAVETALAGSPITASLGVASYVHAEVNGVTSIGMRSQAGTVRRRQDQLV